MHESRLYAIIDTVLRHRTKVPREEHLEIHVADFVKAQEPVPPNEPLTNSVLDELQSWRERWTLTEREQAIFESFTRKPSVEQRLSDRARIFLTLNRPEMTLEAAAATCQCDRKTITLWRDRWLDVYPPVRHLQDQKIPRRLLVKVLLVSLADEERIGRPPKISPAQCAQIIAIACENPTLSQRPTSHWTATELTAELIKRHIVAAISPRTVSRVLQELDLKPHLLRYWETPSHEHSAAFFDHVNLICDLYLQALKLYHHQVYLVSTDEKTGIQALERCFPLLPLKPGMLEHQEFNYARHGTLALIATLMVATGKIVDAPVGPTRKEEDFYTHIQNVVKIHPDDSWIFVVDQLNTHKSESLVRFVAKECQITGDLGEKGKSGILRSLKTRLNFLVDPTHRIRFVYLPTHTSWMNQIEMWFSILTRKLLKRSSFSSLPELRERILAFVDYFNTTLAKPFKWTYRGKVLQH